MVSALVLFSPPWQEPGGGQSAGPVPNWRQCQRPSIPQATDQQGKQTQCQQEHMGSNRDYTFIFLWNSQASNYHKLKYQHFSHHLYNFAFYWHSCQFWFSLLAAPFHCQLKDKCWCDSIAYMSFSTWQVAYWFTSIKLFRKKITTLTAVTIFPFMAKNKR